MARTIEIISRHTGTVNVKVHGVNRKIHFEERRPGVGLAVVDDDEAEALLVPGLKNDFWKEALEVKTPAKPDEVKKTLEPGKESGEGKAPGEGEEGKEGKEGEEGKKSGEGKQEEIVTKRNHRDVIADIKVAETAAAVDALIVGEDRPSVLSSAEVRKEELAAAAPKE